MDTRDQIPKSNFYVVIRRRERDGEFILEFKPIYVNEFGRWDNRRTENSRVYFIKFNNPQDLKSTMEQIIDYLYEKSKSNSIYDYLKIELDHKGIVMCKPHSSLMSIWGSIIELLYQLINKGIFLEREINYKISTDTTYPYDGE